MIVELHLQNFRGFKNHTIPLKPFTVIVGRNNAGKSTIVEALRLISIVMNRFKGDLTRVPSRWEFPRSPRGIYPFKNLEINLDSVFYNYGDPPAVVSATFNTGQVIEVTVTDQTIFARKGRRKRGIIGLINGLSRVSTLPQVAPVARQERVLNDDYVRASMSSALAPLHFRNQLAVLNEHFTAFKEAAEQTWPGLRIRSLETHGSLPNPSTLSLLVEDNHFTAEVAWMGHGLQMWLQMIWFLSRAEDHETVILDEPDVYMHADLQRRLVRFLRNRHQQVIIATHSSEIMAEVLPENILIVDRSLDKSDFAASLPAVQKIFNGLGSVHNLQLSRLWNARRFLMVEGDDIRLLKQFQDKIFPATNIPIDTIPSISLGGWGGWNRAVGSDILLNNAAGEGIVTYCIFDSDYFTDTTRRERYSEAKKRGISLHIWQRKELENYLLKPGAIRRAIQNGLPPEVDAPTELEISKQLEQIAADLKEEVIDAIATQISATERKLTIATVNQQARASVSARWKTEALSVIPGKAALSKVADWARKSYKVSLSGQLIAYHMLARDVPPELRDVLEAIEECKPFS